jgi:hypothetical protein
MSVCALLTDFREIAYELPANGNHAISMFRFYNKYEVGFEVLTAVTMKRIVVWVVTPFREESPTFRRKISIPSLLS